VNLPDQVFSCNHARGDRVSKGMELDRLMSFQVLLSEEHIEVGILFDRDIDLVRVLGSKAWATCSSFAASFYHCVVSLFLLK